MVKQSEYIIEAFVSPTVDVSVQNHGSVVLLTPETDAAREWFSEHLPEDALTFGRATAVEPRYVQDIIDGMLAAGLEAR